MKKVVLSCFSFFVLCCCTCVITICCGDNHNVINNKILYEYDNGGVVVTNSINEFETNDYAKNDISMQISFGYDSFDDIVFEKTKLSNESFKECSKRYHSSKNKKLVKLIGLEEDDCFVSEYTPFIFLNGKKYKSFDEAQSIAERIAKFDFVNSVRVFNPDIYELEIDSLESNDNYNINAIESTIMSPPSYVDLRTTMYDNFPVGTYYKGRNIKIGILDTGIFRTGHFNFTDTTVECVYDTYVNSSETEHPTWVASVLGGKFGYASLASLYYVDVNSDVGYVGIEKLINKGCNIINMSISSKGSDNGEYDTGLEAYLDYIYTSTKVIMVAATGNDLNKEGSRGRVSFPSLCANVISVGSITSSGVPSNFSNYNSNGIESKPNLVAVGTSRLISSNLGSMSGTSLSAPAVSGAIALFFEKNGIKELPEVLSVLSATANDSIIDTTNQTITVANSTITFTNNLKSNGTRERTGAGALDVTALLNYNNHGLDNTLNFNSKSDVVLKQLYLSEGQTIKISCAWQRNANVEISRFLWWETGRSYTIEELADFDLGLYDSNGDIVNKCFSTNTNVEVLTVNITKNGYYDIKISPFKNYQNLHNLNYSYVID